MADGTFHGLDSFILSLKTSDRSSYHQGELRVLESNEHHEPVNFSVSAPPHPHRPVSSQWRRAGAFSTDGTRRTERFNLAIRVKYPQFEVALPPPLCSSSRSGEW